MAELLSQEEIDALLETVSISDDNKTDNHKNFLSSIFTSFQKIGIKFNNVNLDKTNISNLFVSEYSFIDYETSTQYVFTIGYNEKFLDYVKNALSLEKDEFDKWVFYFSFEKIITHQDNSFFINTLFNNDYSDIKLLKQSLKKLEQPFNYKNYKLININFKKNNEYFNPYSTYIFIDTIFDIDIDDKKYDFWIKFERIDAIPIKKLNLLKKSKILIDGDDFLIL